MIKSKNFLCFFVGIVLSILGCKWGWTLTNLIMKSLLTICLTLEVLEVKNTKKNVKFMKFFACLWIMLFVISSDRVLFHNKNKKSLNIIFSEIDTDENNFVKSKLIKSRNKKNDLGFTKLEKIFSNLDVDWLLDLNESIYKPNQESHEYQFNSDLSIIIAARNEDEFLAKTIISIIENTNLQVLKEIIVIDDYSDIPVIDYLNTELPKKYFNYVKVYRFNKANGLIRSRVAGADLSSGSNIFFIDAHCKVDKNWEKGMLEIIQNNYKTLVSPVIYDIDRYTWENLNVYGIKMLFDWNFEFFWYEDSSQFIPITSGGIFMISRKWWIESGKYDIGMLEWGSENIESSIRIWLCGGKIVNSKTSYVGHIFSRDPKPEQGINYNLIDRIRMNQKRAALVWLDDYYQFFINNRIFLDNLKQGPGLEYRQMLRGKLDCDPFEIFVDKFKNIFERRGLLLNDFFRLKDIDTNLCLSLNDDKQVINFNECDFSDDKQEWQNILNNRMIMTKNKLQCLDMTSFISNCKFWNLLRDRDRKQQVSLIDQKLVHFSKSVKTQSYAGREPFDYDENLVITDENLCLTKKGFLPCKSHETIIIFLQKIYK